MNNFKTNGDLFIFLQKSNLDISNHNTLTRLITDNLKIHLLRTSFEELQHKISKFTKYLKSKWIHQIIVTIQNLSKLIRD